MIPIVDRYLEDISAGMKVLDVGCGSWSRIRSHCRTVGAQYEGIDMNEEYFGVRTVATRLENLADLSFEDETFDRVIGNQTMEHWAENGCSLKWGIYQCFRVSKMGGCVLLNVPIHFHGTKTFMLGRIGRIKQILADFSGMVTFEEWGRPSAPLADLYPYPGYAPLKYKPAYVLDIQAIKDRPLPKIARPRMALHGRWSELAYYPLSYNCYRVLRKLGFFPKDPIQRVTNLSL